MGVAELPYARRAASLGGSVIDSSTSLLERQAHDIVRFAMGSPAHEAVPAAALAAAAAARIGPQEPGAFDYGATEGEPSLRRAVVELTGDEPGAAESNLLITSGGMQGIDLVCKLFVDPGDLVAVESPTYTNGSATVLSYQGRLLEVPLDADGMRVDLLEREVAARGEAPKLIYTIPTFQNPSGVTLSLERRLRLLELAEAWGTVVLEDDPYGLLRFAGEPLPSLVELSGRADRVIGVHTFSKILAPGLRVGWVRAAAPIVERMIAAKQAMDTCTNVPAQLLIADFLASGAMADHLERLRAEYRGRKLGMIAALEACFGEAGGEEAVTWSDPQGGFFIWVTLPAGVDTEALFEPALAAGVAYIPGNAFSPAGGFANALRLCFTFNDPARTLVGIERLRGALEGSAR